MYIFIKIINTAVIIKKYLKNTLSVENPNINKVNIDKIVIIFIFI